MSYKQKMAYEPSYISPDEFSTPYRHYTDDPSGETGPEQAISAPPRQPALPQVAGFGISDEMQTWLLIGGLGVAAYVAWRMLKP